MSYESTKDIPRGEFTERLNKWLSERTTNPLYWFTEHNATFQTPKRVRSGSNVLQAYKNKNKK